MNKFTTALYLLDKDVNENNIYVKRDDLIPFCFGGNKVRIAQEFLADMKSKKKNYMVAYGNPRSNLSRALVNLCKKDGVPCIVISPSENNGSRIETANSKIVKNILSSEIIECNKAQVCECVTRVLNQLTEAGYKPYYIYGDASGKGNEKVAVNAYYKAYGEIKRQAKQKNIRIDYIFLATGTGMTQSGLLAGKIKNNGKEKIVGISIARTKDTEEKIIEKYISSFFHNTNIDFKKEINVCEDYLCGGYGETNGEINKTIIDVFNQYGLPLDITYTGKAYYGMKNYIKEKGIKEKNILFLHTGGTPLFFDFLESGKKNYTINRCEQKDKLITFLTEIDKSLPIKLSERVNLSNYAEKVLSRGNVLSIEKEDKIVSSIIFYCNDNISFKAYITLIGTIAGNGKNGYAKSLLCEAEQYAREAGMKKIGLDTEKTNQRALSLYIKQGYKVISINEKIYMEKDL